MPGDSIGAPYDRLVDRWIAHVDMDAFFASVELLKRPELRGKPFIVSGSSPRSVVTTASYEARKFGIGSAMPSRRALALCSDLIVVPPDFDSYQRASKGVMEILRRFSDTVEVAGLDEAYMDLSESPAPKTRARQVKQSMRDELRLTCSVGLAPNKLLAKIASDLDKPDGLTLLTPDDMHRRVGDRSARLIPGVGPRTAQRLERIGVRTVRELAASDPARLQETLGTRTAAWLFEAANGRDVRGLETSRVRKSESREVTFPEDVDDEDSLRATVERLATDVAGRARKDGFTFRTITLKIRLRPFRTFTRSRSVKEQTDDPAVLRDTALALFDAFERDAPVRLLGVGVTALAPAANERDEGEGTAGQQAITL